MAISKESQINNVTKLVTNHLDSDFFGELILKFEHGNIVFIKEVTNIKPDTAEFKNILESYLKDDDKEGEASELTLRKIKGKPHITLVNKGGVDSITERKTSEFVSNK